MRVHIVEDFQINFEYKDLVLDWVDIAVHSKVVEINLQNKGPQMDFWMEKKVILRINCF